MEHLNSLELLSYAKNKNLYKNLVAQLNKDFNLANITMVFSEESTPKELKRKLHEKLYVLILEKFTMYLNLLYIVDVPEKSVKEISNIDVVDVSEAVVFLILKREMQKVWFRCKYED